ncbi:MAG: hypothetical protein ACXVCY_10260 [Pseudobdellovibrionaceae bacterium]
MKKLFALIGIFISLASCSRVSILTRYADTLIWWEVDRLVDFSSDKRESAKVEIEKMYQIIAATSFPILAKSLSHLPEEINTGKPFHQLPCVEEAIQIFSSLFVAVRPSAEIMAGLIGPQEYTNLVSNYRKKIAKEAESLDQQKREQSHWYKDAVEFFIGDLTAEQESFVNDFYAVESYPFDLQLENKRRNLKLIEETHGDSQKLHKLAGDFFVSDSVLELSDFKRARSLFIEKLTHLTTKIVKSLNEQQRVKLRKNSLQLSDEFKSFTITN